MSLPSLFSRYLWPASLLLVVTGLALPAAAASRQPQWEAGAGIAAYAAPHYLGSDQSATYVVPVPFLIYRGEKVQADRGGLFGRLYESAVLDVRVSAGGSLPVNSEDNDAREGMPDLDIMLEAGPTLQFNLHRQSGHQLRFDVPLRAAFSLGSKLEYQGLVFNPRLHYGQRLDGWRLDATLGPVYATEAYHDYFYEVERQYATASRPAFNAEAGYIGMRSSLGVSRHFGRFYAGTFLNYYNLNNNANDDSPLLMQEDYLAFSFVVSWIFAKSDTLVEL